MPFIAFQGTSKSYDGRAFALHPLDLGVTKGEFLTFLGPSGSGKTTTLMILAGFETPTAGDVLVCGRSIRSLPPERRGIGMVFQSYALFPHLTVAENVAFPLAVRRRPKAEIAERVRDALAMVQLDGMADRRPAQISGGQQQRVAVARALVFQPEIVLLDEPLGALDRQLREQMQTELKSIHDRLGVTMIYVTHDQAEAMTMSDRVAIFHEGRLCQVATPNALYDAPDSVFVAQFLGETNVIAGRVMEARGGQCRVEVGDGVGVVATSVGECAPGRTVTLTVRPERVALGEEAVRRANCYEGHAIGITFLGDQLRSRWALLGQQDFIVKVPNSKRHDLPPIGGAGPGRLGRSGLPGDPGVTELALAAPAGRRPMTWRIAPLTGYALTLAPAVVLLALLYVVPLARVLWISVTEPHAGLANYALLFTSASIQRALLTTLRVAATVTAISLVLGYAAAYAMHGASRPAQRVMLFCVLFPFWISVLIRAFAWVTLLRSNGVAQYRPDADRLIAAPVPLVRNETGVVIGMVHFMLPYAILILYAAMRGADMRLVAVARGLGASRTQAFWRVMLPLTRPGIIAAGFFVFIFSLGFYVTPAILGGGKVLMVAEYIALQINETLRWGLGTMLAATLVISILGAMWLVSRVVDLRRLMRAA